MTLEDNTLLILVVVLALLVFSIKKTDKFGNCKNFDTQLGQSEIQKYYDEMNKNNHIGYSPPPILNSSPAPILN